MVSDAMGPGDPGVPEGAGQGGPPPGPPPPFTPPPPSAPPPPPGAGRGPARGYEYATFGARLIAFIIDSVIVGVFTGIVSFITGGGLLGLLWFGGLGFGPPFRFDLGLARIAFAVLSALISGAYFIYFWMRTGATPGQSFLGLEVRNAADGALPTQDQAIRRWAFLIVPFVSVFPVVGFFVFLYQVYLAYTVTTDPNRQGFHDKQAGTVVIRRIG